VKFVSTPPPLDWFWEGRSDMERKMLRGIKARAEKLAAHYPLSEAA
jgi:hypothetical protein